MQSKQAVLFWFVCTYCMWGSQWISSSLATQQSLCVHVRERVLRLMDSLGPLWRGELISCLFEFCLNLQSIQANNADVLECSCCARRGPQCNEGEGFSCDQASVGLFFVLFECTQYAHLMHLCGLYPWTINLLAMYNMGASVMPLFHFKKEKRRCVPE